MLRNNAKDFVSEIEDLTRVGHRHGEDRGFVFLLGVYCTAYDSLSEPLSEPYSKVGSGLPSMLGWWAVI